MPNPISDTFLRFVQVGGVVLIATVVAFGLAGEIDRKHELEASATVTSDRFERIPAGASAGVLGGESPLQLTAVSASVSTLLESPDPGLVELGVRVIGLAGSSFDAAGIVGEFALVTRDGRVYTPQDLYDDGGAVSFTINADLRNPSTLEGADDLRLEWRHDGRLVAVWLPEGVEPAPILT